MKNLDVRIYTDQLNAVDFKETDFGVSFLFWLVVLFGTFLHL